MQLLATMCLVNCCVIDGSNKILFPWSILSTGESGVTVQQFYEQKVIQELNSSGEVELEAAFLGKSKESLDKIELLLSLDSFRTSFTYAATGNNVSGELLCYRRLK